MTDPGPRLQPPRTGQDGAAPPAGEPPRPGHDSRVLPFPVPATGGRALSDRLPSPWLFPVLAFAATWGLLLASWQVGNQLHRSGLPWARYFESGDGAAITTIAVHSYATVRLPQVPPARAGYFPVLPELVRTLSDVTKHDFLSAGVIVAVVTGLAAVVMVWALCAEVAGHRAADRATLLFCAFPGALSLATLSALPLGVALAAGSLLAATRRGWILAGLLGLIATATHPLLVALVPALAVTAVHAIVTRRDWRSLVAPVLAPLGVVSYFVLLGGDYHDAGYWFGVEWRVLARRVASGTGRARALAWASPALHPVTEAVLIVVAVALVAGLVAVATARRPRLPLPVAAYTVLLGGWLIVTALPSPRPGAAWLALGIFPAAATRLPGWAYWPLLAASAGLLAFLSAWLPNS